MKTASAALQGHFGQAVTTLAVIWKITRQDGTVMGFTTLDKDIVYNSVTYKASTGFLPTANETKSDMSVDSVEVTGFLDSAVIKEADIRAGVYDYAKVEQRVINYQDLTMGDIILRKGIVGNIKMVNGLFNAEVRGLTQYLSTVVGSLYGPICRAELFSTASNDIDPGSKYLCNVKQADYIQSGSVNTSVDALTIVPNSGLLQIGSTTPAAVAPVGWFSDGVITFTSGLNNGFSFEVKTWDGTTLTLFLPLPYVAIHNDTFSIIPGCDKTATATGCLKFQGYDKNQNIVAATNIKNFRGEPFIPGTDLILQYPDAK